MSNQHTTSSMSKEVLYLGLDVHADSIVIAIAEAGRDGEVRHYGTISPDLHNVEKVLRKIGHPGKELRICYEAGPCGFDSVASSGSSHPSAALQGCSFLAV
jgi:hypothetical protein